ncbi:MAG: transpeptidase family protein [Winogradskyella sp.]|uniref:penicillin-binding protein n=1 Tax=Winogradskyella sp. TaxID=1883156 RepID=UPI001836F446|nr:penicillin-binding protein [Winogradskyella sp.]MBT8246163.1 transpeptidase family protein [Winogradskyella sp.]NNK23747.1 transpeptidase family protein [Winogradskyella sp.]
MFVFAIAVLFKLCSIQFIDGDKYRAMAQKRSIKAFEIPANRGNVYSADGSLLATSIPKYDVGIDAVTSSDNNFKKYIKPLCDSLAVFTGKSSGSIERKIKKARNTKDQYLLLLRNLSYSEFIRIRSFPLFKLGSIRGGFVYSQKTKREHPLGSIAERSIGYERIDENGYATRVGIDGAFGKDYLRGENGRRLKQRIGKGEWKPIRDANEIEPKNGYDIYTTIDVNIQDIAHHSLLGQLEKYEAEHGCVVVMDVKTGEIKAIANLGRNREGKYYERLNYAVGESHEPGSTFKVMAMMVALEDKVIDTSTVIDTKNGRKMFYGRPINDSGAGHGKISAAKTLEVSSNIGLATIVDDNYSKQPEKFLKRLRDWRLDKELGVSIIGEGEPVIPKPGDKIWSRNALPSMAYGYNMQLTPLQTLAFYNAIANKGELIKPRFLRAVKEFDRNIEVFEKEVLVDKICSDETLLKIKDILKNIVERGTGERLYSKTFSMAGKTGTARADYANIEEWLKDRKYVSSFAGYFPADKPKYSCIVVIHKPSTKVGYYGADVSGPVFKRIAQKIYTDTPLIDEIDSVEFQNPQVVQDFEKFNTISNTYKTIMPNLIGIPAMDAVAFLENMEVKVKVKLKGSGVIKSQSISKDKKLKFNQTIVLEAS